MRLKFGTLIVPIYFGIMTVLFQRENIPDTIDRVVLVMLDE